MLIRNFFHPTGQKRQIGQGATSTTLVEVNDLKINLFESPSNTIWNDRRNKDTETIQVHAGSIAVTMSGVRKVIETGCLIVIPYDTTFHLEVLKELKALCTYTDPTDI